MSFRVRGIASAEVEEFQHGGPDANQQAAQLHIASAGANPAIAYVHIRSKFNCFQCRVERG